MPPRNGLLLTGTAVIIVALFSLLALVTAYWPFQSVVQVIAPFLILSILTSVGLSLILTAFLTSRIAVVDREDPESVSVVDSLLSETGRRR